MLNETPSNFQCPNCGSQISISIEVLLQGYIAKCAGCETTLKVKPKESEQALSALRQFVAKVQDIKAQGQL